MRKYIILLLIIFLIFVPDNTEAKNEGYEIVSKLSKENITLYAKKIGSLYLC